METSVAPKKRLPGHTLSALCSPEALSAHRAAVLSETPDRGAVLLPRGFLWGRLQFCLGRGEKMALNQPARQNFVTQRYLYAESKLTTRAWRGSSAPAPERLARRQRRRMGKGWFFFG